MTREDPNQLSLPLDTKSLNPGSVESATEKEANGAEILNFSDAVKMHHEIQKTNALRSILARNEDIKEG
jgi:hypothetical protein